MLGRGGQGQAVHKDIFFWNAVLLSAADDFFGNSKALFGKQRDTAFIQCQCNNGSTVFFNQREDCLHGLLLTVYRVDDRLTIIDTKRCLDRLRVGGIQL